MSLSVTFKTDRKLEELRKNLAQMPAWMPAMLRRHLPPLGRRVEEIMVAAIEPHRYTGELADSITSEYDDADYSVSIFPTAQRGNYDAGTILELGTRPIRRAPWAPIKAWADFRGVPAFPVWYAIRMRGVRPHPFLRRTLDTAAGAMSETARRLANEMAEAVLSGTGTVSIPSGGDA